MDKKRKTQIALIAVLWILFGISSMILIRNSVFFHILPFSQWGTYSALLITLYSVVFVLGYLFASVSLFAVIASRPRYEMIVAYLKNRWVLVAALIYIFVLHIVAILLLYAVAMLLLVWTLGLFAPVLLLAKSEKQIAEWTLRALIVFLALVVSSYTIEGLLVLSHADLGFNGYNIAGQRYTWGHKIVNNSLGFREKEFVTPKPQDVYRIMVLGDSITFGYGLAEEERYSNRLEALLSSKFPYKKIEVLNFGEAALATVHERDILAHYQDMVQPDLIIVGFCYNDTQPKRGGNYSVEMDRYLIQVFLIQSLKLAGFNDISEVLDRGYGKLLTQLGKIPDWNIALQRTYEKESDEWKQFQEALRDIKTMSDDMRLPSPVFAALDGVSSTTKPTDYNNPDETLKIYLRCYHQAEEEARKIGFTTMNFEEEFARETSNGITAVNRKDGHPSSKMNEIYARKLFQVITPIIESYNGRVTGDNKSLEHPVILESVPH